MSERARTLDLAGSDSPTGTTVGRGLAVRDVVVHYPDPATAKGPEPPPCAA
ncbi:hypothetical protein NKG05_15935 [Oerskovia sp. M15]